MSERLKVIGTELSEGKIPEQLQFMREFGEHLKNNPQEYKELRHAITSAKSDEEKFDVLRDFSLSEPSIRRLIPEENDPHAIGVVTATIIITITLTPRPAH